jgi:hypothetical protein
VAFPTNGSKEPQMDLVNYSRESFPASSQQPAALFLPGSLPGVLSGLAKSRFQVGYRFQAGALPMEPLSGQSLVKSPGGRLRFVPRNMLCPLETVVSVCLSMCVCVCVCVCVYL